MTSSLPVLDAVALNALRRLPSVGGCHMLSAVADLYFRDAPPLLLQMEAAFAARDLPALGRAAHALKSYAGNIGATALMIHLKSLEAVAKVEYTVACAALLPSLQLLFAEALAELLVEAAAP